MDAPVGIVVFGANGSGKTTLGHELAKALNFRHIDVEDYYFEKWDIFYKHPHEKNDVICMILADINRYGSFVFTGVTGDYGNEIVSLFKLAVCLLAPVDLRMERIRQRAIDKYGERAMPNGDMYQNREEFVEFVRNRDYSVIDKWAATLTCPIIHIDSTKSISECVKTMIDAYCSL